MKRKFLSVLLVAIMAILTITKVKAIDVAAADYVFTQEGEFNSTRFIAGNEVINKGIINGISFIAGNSVEVNGKASYGFYAGNNLIISDTIENDLFLAGNIIELTNESLVNRDAYIVGNRVTIKSNIKRDLRIAASYIDLSNATIDGDVYIEADKIILGENTKIAGKFTYFDNASIEGMDKVSLSELVKLHSEDLEEEKVNILVSVKEFFISTLAALIVVLVLFYLIPKTKDILDEIKFDVKEVFKNILIGLTVLVVVPILSIIGLFTGILTPLCIILLIVYGISIYLGYLIVYYLIGRIITSKVFKVNSVYLTITLGIIVGKLIELIPFIGELCSFLILLYGLGLMFKLIKDIHKN